MERVYIGSDHRGFELKNRIARFLKGQSIEVVDLGPGAYDKSDDYPDYTEKVCKEVLYYSGKGILICGSGNGVAISANKIKGIYAALCWNEASARMAKQDGSSNVLCLPASHICAEEAEMIVEAWLSDSFSGAERHVRRIEKMKAIERRSMK